MPEDSALHQAEQELAQAKATLLHMAAEVQPLAAMRAHPWATAAASVAIGATLGSGPTRLSALIHLARSAAAIVPPLIHVLHQARQRGQE